MNSDQIFYFAIFALMLGASFFYVFVMPFLGPQSGTLGRPKTRVSYLRERKDAVYENLRDLNFEYRAGKVPDADYQQMKSSLQDEAAAILAEIARLEAKAEAARLARERA